MEFRDALKDLVYTTSPVGFENIRVGRNDENQVIFESYTSDKEVIMKAYVKEDVPDVVGSFGLGSLGMLQGLLGLNTYKTDSTKIVPVVVDGEIQKFKFTSDDAVTEFVVLSGKYVQKQPKFIDNGFDVQVSPSAAKVNELKSYSSVFKSLSSVVTPYTEDNQLRFKVGNANKAVHNGSLAFSPSTSDLKESYSYPVERILQALTRINNCTSCTLSISTRGVLNINIDTGICVYNFYMMGK